MGALALHDTMNTPLTTPAPAPPRRLWALSLLLGLMAWGSSAARHYLLQSNAYDLGLFDQWAWLIGSGSAPISRWRKCMC